MDEYTSEIFMGGKNTIVMHNTCEDSLLAAPIILDLVLLAELSTRIQFKSEGEVRQFIVLVILGFLFSLNRGFDVLNLIFLAGKVSFFPSCGHHTQLPHQGTACAAGNPGG